MNCCRFTKKETDPVILTTCDNRHRPEKPRKSCLCKCFKCTIITVIIIALVLFIVIFVVLPLVVTFSLAVQTFLMFPNFDQPSNPQYTNFKLYGARATRNFYVTVNDYYDNDDKVSLGLWHLLPEEFINQTETNENFDYNESLMNSNYPVIIYFHGNSGTRIYPLSTYNVLRKFFHVLAFDYRSYADSSKAKLSEEAVVSDAMQLYKWVTEKTKSPIYIWGHSLGTALSTHTVANLRDKGIIPHGLFLEAPFTRMREEVPYHPIGKIYSWMPWFNLTIQDPLENNGFLFDTRKNILKVDSPIMIMHAEDDPIIPYTFGRTLFDIAIKSRDLAKQGNATYHQFPSYLRHSHLQITDDPDIPTYIDEFLTYCKEFNKRKTRTNHNTRK